MFYIGWKVDFTCIIEWAISVWDFSSPLSHCNFCYIYLVVLILPTLSVLLPLLFVTSNFSFCFLQSCKDIACSTGAMNHLKDNSVLINSWRGLAVTVSLENKFYYAIHLDYFLSQGFCLIWNSGMRNHGWESVRSQRKLHMTRRNSAIWFCHCLSCMHISCISYCQKITCLNARLAAIG